MFSFKCIDLSIFRYVAIAKLIQYTENTCIYYAHFKESGASYFTHADCSVCRSPTTCETYNWRTFHLIDFKLGNCIYQFADYS